MNKLIIKKVIHVTDTGNIINDGELKRLINNFLGRTDLDADITATDLGEQGFIDASYNRDIASEKVSSLAGLENASIIEGIDISGNEVSSIYELREIVSLVYLEASENKIEELQNVNRNLLNVNLQKNGIKNITGIGRLEGLSELNLAGNEIVDISELGQLTNLNKVILTNNKIADVSMLNGFQVTDSNGEKWAALGGQTVELSPVFYEKENDKIIITLSLDGKLKDLAGNVPAVIKNIIYRDLTEGISVAGEYADTAKTINYQIDEIPQLVSFDFNTSDDNTLADSFNGNVVSYIAMNIENGVIKDYINEKIKEAGGGEKDPILYKDYKEKGIDSLTIIDLSNKGLANLKDIDLFPGATNIDVKNNNLVDMSDLFKLNNIRNVSISAENQRQEFNERVVLGQNYIFNLNRLSINETGNDKFVVEFSISDISHNGSYDSTTNTIKWTNLNNDSTLTFNYIKSYKEPNGISGAAISSLAAGDPYNNIVDNGTVTINLSVNPGRGLDLF